MSSQHHPLYVCTIVQKIRALSSGFLFGIDKNRGFFYKINKIYRFARDLPTGFCVLFFANYRETTTLAPGNNFYIRCTPSMSPFLF